MKRLYELVHTPWIASTAVLLTIMFLISNCYEKNVGREPRGRYICSSVFGDVQQLPLLVSQPVLSWCKPFFISETVGTAGAQSRAKDSSRKRLAHCAVCIMSHDEMPSFLLPQGKEFQTFQKQYIAKVTKFQHDCRAAGKSISLGFCNLGLLSVTEQ